MKSIIIKSISILFLVLTSCKSSTEKKIIGSWKGTCTNKAFNLKPRYCEMEFNDKGEFYVRHSDLDKIELDTPIIQEYKIIGDSLVTYHNKSRHSYFIEFISEKKIVLNDKLGSMNDFYFELNKQ